MKKVIHLFRIQYQRVVWSQTYKTNRCNVSSQILVPAKLPLQVGNCWQRYENCRRILANIAEQTVTSDFVLYFEGVKKIFLIAYGYLFSEQADLTKDGMNSDSDLQFFVQNFFVGS